jgi:protein-disulfide isomerase
MEQTIHGEQKEEVEHGTHEVKHHTVHKKKFTLTTPSAIILAALILGASHVLYAVVLNSKNTGPITLFTGKAITEKDYPTGDTKSDVIVVEYSDTECPFCARLHPVMSQIQSEYKDKISFVYRHFPLTQIHPGAFGEAQAIECLGKQLGSQKRREYIDQMFTYKTSNNSMTLPKNGKEDLAKNFGINMPTFSSCLSGEESSKIVSDSIQDGIAAGVSGTPATFILKRDGDQYEVFALIEGAREYDYFKAALEAALK